MKYLKTYKIFEALGPQEMMRIHYGDDVLNTCDEMIQDIDYILLDLKDDGYDITSGYTPMTWALANKFPEIMVNISKKNERLQEENREEFDAVILRLNSYVVSHKWRYSAGFYDNHKTLGITIFGDKRIVNFFAK